MEIAIFLSDSYDRPISLALTIQDMGGTEDTFSNVLTKTRYINYACWGFVSNCQEYNAQISTE